MALSMDVVPSQDERISRALVLVSEGKTLKECAEAAGIHVNTINRWLLTKVPDEYRVVQQHALIQKIIEADENLEGAEDHLGVQKYDRVAKYARWDAERRLPDLFAQRTEVTGANGAPLVALDTKEVARRLAFLLAAEANVIDVVPE